MISPIDDLLDNVLDPSSKLDEVQLIDVPKLKHDLYTAMVELIEGNSSQRTWSEGHDLIDWRNGYLQAKEDNLDNLKHYFGVSDE